VGCLTPSPRVPTPEPYSGFQRSVFYFKSLLKMVFPRFFLFWKNFYGDSRFLIESCASRGATLLLLCLFLRYFCMLPCYVCCLYFPVLHVISPCLSCTLFFVFPLLYAIAFSSSSFCLPLLAISASPFSCCYYFCIYIEKLLLLLSISCYCCFCIRT